jgi:hypothetical protein
LGCAIERFILRQPTARKKKPRPIALATERGIQLSPGEVYFWATASGAGGRLRA